MVIVCTWIANLHACSIGPEQPFIRISDLKIEENVKTVQHGTFIVCAWWYDVCYDITDIMQFSHL